MRGAALVLLGGALVALGGCGSAELKAAGEPCVASAECAAGLVCDLAGSRTCADHVTADATVIDAGPIDGPVPIDAAIDAAPDAAIDAPP